MSVLVADSVLRDLSAQTIPAAMEANKRAYGTLLGTLPDGQFHDEPDVIWFETGLPLDLLNGVLHTNLERHVASGAIARVLAHFARRRLPFQWRVGPTSQPRDIGDVLQAHGIVHVEDEPGMALDLHALREDLPVAVDLRVALVTTDEQLEAWMHVWGCGAPEEVIGLRLAAYRGLQLGTESPLRLLLGTRDGKPVATAAVFLGGGLAAIEDVVTLPDRRRQGIGAAITLAAARTAREQGYRIAVLTASPMGINIYRRLGFRDYCTFSTYEWHLVGSAESA